jgi:VWFA-related protein
MPYRSYRSYRGAVAAGLVVTTLASVSPGILFSQEAPPTFGERVDVEVVNVDVVVTDASGARITDLIREDFLLEVDGKVVPIDYFAPPSAKRTAPAARPAEGADPAVVDMSRANLFVFVDQSALEWRTSQQILDEVEAFVLPRTGGTERIMVAAFANNLRILSPPTSDRKRIEEAFVELGKLRGRGSLVAAERNKLEREVRANSRPRAQAEITDPDTGEVTAEQTARVAGQDFADTENLRLQVESFGEQQIDPSRRCENGSARWRRSKGVSRSSSRRRVSAPSPTHSSVTSSARSATTFP